MNIQIRRATPADADLIADLSRQTFFDTFAKDNSPEDMELFMKERYSKEFLANQVKNEEGIFLLAFDGNETLGFARLAEGDQWPEFEGKPAIEIAKLYAVASAIGKGVGKALMQTCLAIAREQQRKIIWLDVWEKNFRAIAFYQQFGFRKFNEQDFILGRDVQRDWVMMREIE